MIIFNSTVTVIIVTLCVSLMLSSTIKANSDQERGVSLLKQKLQRARHLKELEYQAEVLERQARIAKAQQQIDKTIGLESVQSVQSSAGLVQQKSSVQYMPLPKVLELTTGTVTFVFSNGEIGVFSVGDQLPSGHRLDHISIVDGVQLSQGTSVFQVNYNW